MLVALDETPVGTFVEIEGAEAGIATTATRLGRGPDSYIVESYRSLFVQHCAVHGLPPGDMVFPR